jgi:hypothetical protein
MCKAASRGLGGISSWNEAFAHELQLNKKQSRLNTGNKDQAKRDDSDTRIRMCPLPFLAVALGAMGMALRRFF